MSAHSQSRRQYTETFIGVQAFKVCFFLSILYILSMQNTLSVNILSVYLMQVQVICNAYARDRLLESKFTFIKNYFPNLFLNFQWLQ